MKVKYLSLLILGLLPTGSTPTAAGAPAGGLSESGTAVAGATIEADATERCAELRAAEASLAEYEVHLLDKLALPDAPAFEKAAWKQQLTYADDSLDALDKALELHRCPTL